jgi:site-specific DNA-cytosine methylase
MQLFRSSLFFHTVRIAVEANTPLILLENVLAILSKPMHPVLPLAASRTVQFLFRKGTAFTNMQVDSMPL